jgi:uncharacterized protein (TIGR00299 family) protein
MKALHLDCFAGVAGDMLLGALIDVGVDLSAVRKALSRLPVKGWRLQVEPVHRKSIRATHLSVQARKGARLPHHLGYAELAEAIRAGKLSKPVAGKSLAVLKALAEAEAGVHGKPVSEVHFHEVGGIDTLVDIVGSVVGLELLGVERVTCSPIPLSHGFVDCAHGRLPVPPPAVTELVKGIPTVPLDIEGETVTPTGAALAVTLADAFGPAPPMTVEAVGYGAGSREWPDVPNVLRVLLGDVADEEAEEATEVVLLEANVDDMNPEHFALAMERCFEAGALDVWLTPIQMKKSRPATTLSALAAPEDAEQVAAAIFENTTTFGIRRCSMSRYCLPRRHEEVATAFGTVRVKVSEGPAGAQTVAPEYEDCLEAAEQTGVPLKAVYAAALKAFGGTARVRPRKQRSAKRRRRAGK